MKLSHYLAKVAMVCLIGWAGFSQAQTLQLSNLGVPNSGSTAMTVTVDPDSPTLAYVGQSFITGTSASNQWALQSVVLGMLNATSDPNPPPTPPFLVSIYSNSGTTPGSLIATLSGNNDPVTQGTYVYTTTTQVILDASTQYWIVASALETTEVGSAYNWLVIDSGSNDFSTQNAGFTVNPNDTLAVSGTSMSWTVFDISANGGNLAFAVNATAIPEPAAGTLAVAALSLFAIGYFVRGKKTACQA